MLLIMSLFVDGDRFINEQFLIYFRPISTAIYELVVALKPSLPVRVPTYLRIVELTALSKNSDLDQMRVYRCYIIMCENFKGHLFTPVKYS